MFNTNQPWPISMDTAINRTELPLKKKKVFAFMRKIGAFDEYNTPADTLQEKGYFTYHFERYQSNRSATLPRVASQEGLDWFKALMIKNLPEVS